MPIKITDRNSGLTQAEVRRLFDYEPGTGDLFYKISTSAKIKVGDVAGCKIVTFNCARQIVLGINYHSYQAHRIIWLWVTGEWPVDEIDHEDGNGWNNCWHNLRPVTHSQNLKNQAVRKTNTSGTTGVVWDKNRNKYLAKIRVDYRIINLGRFMNIDEAILARKAAEAKYFGEFARK